MFEIKINCNKHNILCNENNNEFTMYYILPESLKKFKNNIKMLHQDIGSSNWNCPKYELIEVESIINPRHSKYDYFIFEFETEEEAFYFKMKYC